MDKAHAELPPIQRADKGKPRASRYDVDFMQARAAGGDWIEVPHGGAQPNTVRVDLARRIARYELPFVVSKRGDTIFLKHTGDNE